MPADQLGAVWPTIEPWVARGLRHGQGDATTTEHMRAHLLLGNLRLWVAMQGEQILGGLIWSTRQSDTGDKIWCEMLFGTSLEEWLPGLVELGLQVKDQVGARCIEASCRPGLVKILQRHGWRRKAVIMEL